MANTPTNIAIFIDADSDTRYFYFSLHIFGNFITIFANFATMIENMTPYPIEQSESAAEFDLCGDVKAGFPSPADDMREKLDLVKMLVKHPASTFFFRISGTSMVDASLDEGDIIIVDKSLDTYDGCIAVCYIDGEFTVKRVSIDHQGVCLEPANERYAPIRISEENDFIVWGVVTFVIKKV